MESFFSLLEALQNAALPSALRVSYLVYPLVNATHIMGLALLFGAIVPLDLRLMGLWPSVPLRTLAAVLLPVALAGFVIAIGAGVVLFSVSAVKYAGLGVFWLKLSLIAAAVANAAMLHRSAAWETAIGGAVLPLPMRLAAGAFISIGLWVGVILCGRLIAYYD